MAKELDVSVAYLIGDVTELDEKKEQLDHKMEELPVEVVRFLYSGITNYFNTILRKIYSISARAVL